MRKHLTTSRAVTASLRLLSGVFNLWFSLFITFNSVQMQAPVHTNTKPIAKMRQQRQLMHCMHCGRVRKICSTKMLVTAHRIYKKAQNATNKWLFPINKFYISIGFATSRRSLIGWNCSFCDWSLLVLWRPSAPQSIRNSTNDTEARFE